MDALDQIRNSFSKYLTYFLWANVPLVIIASLAVGQEGTLWVALIAVVIAGVPTAMLFGDDEDSMTQKYMVSAALALMPAVLVFVFRGHPWQIDVHMYFFATLALTSLLCHPVAIFTAAAVIAVHHLLLNFLVPTWVFPEGADFFRVVLHAVVVVVETIALFWMATKLIEVFSSVASAEKLAAANATAARMESREAAAAQEKAEAALAAAEEAKEQVAAIQSTVKEDKHEAEAAVIEARNSRIEDFQKNLGALLSDIADVSKKLEIETKMLAQISNDTTDAINVATGATSGVGDSVNSVAASAEEMSASISEIARQVELSEGVAQQAKNYAGESENRITALSERADKINDVLKMIGDIAEQTNLLALNATIEAARAGEAGRGFAVVANEVKSLANQSASATQEIGALLADIKEATDGAVEVNQQIVVVVSQITENSSSISASISEQSVATEEIARSAQMAASGTIEASTSVDKLNDVAKRISRAAQLTSGAVETLSEKSAALSERADEFVASMRE